MAKKMFKVRGVFLDAEKIINSMSRATRRALSHMGARVRLSARSAIGRPPATRLPPRPAGKPPRGRTGRLRDFIFFTYDPDRESVVIGPARLQGVANDNAPRLLEHGGTGIINGLPRSIRPRPYMTPSMEKELPKLAALWRNTLK